MFLIMERELIVSHVATVPNIIRSLKTIGMLYEVIECGFFKIENLSMMPAFYFKILSTYECF